MPNYPHPTDGTFSFRRPSTRPGDRVWRHSLSSLHPRSGSRSAGRPVCSDVDGSDDDGAEAMLAVQRGAAAVVTESNLALSVPVFVVKDSRESLANIAHALAGYPSRQLPVTTVFDGTYTVGTTLLLSSVLEQAGLETSLTNEAGSWDGSRSMPNAATLRSPLAWARWLAECGANQTDQAIVGLTAETSKQRALEATELSHVVLTSLKPERGHSAPEPGRRIATARKSTIQRWIAVLLP